MATTLVLLGYVLDLAGSFILAAAAIGLERIGRVTERLEWLRGRLSDNRPEERRFDWRDPARWTAGIASMLGIGLVMLVVQHRFPQALKSRSWGIVVSLSAGGLASIIGVGFVFLVRLSLRGLRSVDEKTRNGSAGAFGFALVFLGFALQFFGTLLGALTR
jgi:hypothetical protein